MANSEEQATDFEWINVQQNIKNSSDQEKENNSEKFSRKFQENPLVPIGCLGTATVLLLGLRSMVKGNRVLSQKMMRYRILAQGMTLGALMLGVLAAGRKSL